MLVAFLSIVAYASLPYLQLMATNLGRELSSGRVVLYWLATVVVGVLVVAAIGRRSVGAARRTAVTLSVFLMAFFNFPFAGRILQEIGVPEAWHSWGWLGLTLLAVTAVALLSRARWLQLYVVIFGVALSLGPAFAIVTYEAAPSESAENAVAPSASASQIPDVGGRSPNVYFFLLDGYARADVLRDLVDVDIQPFLGWLESRKFEVSDEAMANYTTTFLSAASTLEMDYLLDEAGSTQGHLKYFMRLRGENTMAETMRAMGYRYVHAFPGVWRQSRCSGVEDLCIGETRTLLSDTDLALLQSTPLWPMTPTTSRAEWLARNSDPGFIVDQLLVNAPDAPYFVFAHLLNPHPPYLRTADCEFRPVEFDFQDWGEGRTVDQYGEAVTCLNQQLTDAIETLLAADPDALVVLQADHGYGPTLDWEGVTLEDAAAQQRLGIFSAMRLPADCDAQVPEDLTPVNTFRIVLNCLDGQSRELLPPRHYGVSYKNADVHRLGP